MNRKRHRPIPVKFPTTTLVYHFSVDDVFRCLIEVSDRHIPLFSHPFFHFLSDLHDEFGVRIGLHIFFQDIIDGKIRTLKDVTNIQKDLAASGSWLFFGPHALSPDISPYMQSPTDQRKVFTKIYRQIERFAGVVACARAIRLHHYSESYELFRFFHSHGVRTLFATDREVGSHRMPDHVKQQLITSGYAAYKGMQFARTQFRVEFLTRDNYDILHLREAFKTMVSRYGCIIFYTHEYELKRPEVETMTRMSLKVLRSLNVPSIIHP